MENREDGGAAMVEPVASTVRPDQLFLDEMNPRLASMETSTEQDELTVSLWTDAAVAEVAWSIAANGYYSAEPLLVVVRSDHPDADQKTYTVVEGNRRLAAVRLLLDGALRRKARATDLPAVSPERRRQLQGLPVLCYPSREAIWPYLGFRHVNGTRPWDSFSKAKYVAHVHEEFGVSVEDIARRIGDQHSTVQRFYLGFRILRQAETETSFDPEDITRRRLFFSHLYTAADQPGYREFLGITPSRVQLPAPVPKAKLPQLEELMVWFFGSKSRGQSPLVRNQNPDLNTLREVISKSASLAALRAGYPLDRAHEVAVGDERRFREALTIAKDELQRATGTVALGFHGEADMLQLIGDIVTLSANLADQMSHNPARNRQGAIRR